MLISQNKKSHHCNTLIQIHTMAIRGIRCTVLVVKLEKECHGIGTRTKETTKMIGGIRTL